MRTTKWIIIIILIALSLILIGMRFHQNDTGPHGGLVKNAGSYKIELKSSSLFFYTYLLSGRGNPISNKSITCRVTLILPDHTESQVAMKRFEGDGFFSETSNLPASTYWISFEVKGETVSARFDDANYIVLTDRERNHGTP